jgi:hypothetical protein
MDLDNKNLQELFELANRIGKRRYHRLTQQDFEDYRKFEHWRYVNGDSECGTTTESKNWVMDHSDRDCPVCGQPFYNRDGRTIDHKLPRSQFPWLSLEFQNFWVICRLCNAEKAEMHWYEYEHFVLTHYPDRYDDVRLARPIQLLQSLKD